MRLAVGIAVAVSGAASAQVVNDPTRPPPGYLTAEPEAVGAGGGPVLQSVIISPTRRAAIINGVTVRQGEKYGDAVLTRVAENEVVLRGGGVNQVLRLYPGVEMRPAGQPAATSGAPQRKAQQAAPAGDGGTKR